MNSDFEGKLEEYAQLTIEVGLNIQPGQGLLVGVPVYNSGVPLEAAPLVRLLAAKAYQKGARFVDVIWGDDEVQLARFEHAPRDTFDEYPVWKAHAILDKVKRGDAILTILGNDPDLLKMQDPELIAQVQKNTLRFTDPAMEYVRRSAINWSVISVPVRAWAQKVFPHFPAEQQITALWDTIFTVCRIDEPNPIKSWEMHIRELAQRCEFLNRKQYSAMRLTSPGTNLLVGLPQDHVWMNTHLTSEKGIPFTANLPTEEIFTLPHKAKVEGVVSATMPLSYGGILIDDFSLTFAEGRVVKVQANKGEAVLQKLIQTDEGACRLGEIALVPHSSPIAQTGLLFYNVLLDENAATHLALGAAYQFCIAEAESMSPDTFAARGGNHSMIHIDFMIGSQAMQVEGIFVNGEKEPVMLEGDWAFEV